MATVKLTTQDFKDKVFNYETEQDWKYLGQLPAIIDFYADWCGPCKMVAPVLEELSKEYEGKLVIYKVNTDVEQELSAVFGIQSIPTMLFIGTDGEPMMQPGAYPKHIFKKIIEFRRNRNILPEQQQIQERFVVEYDCFGSQHSPPAGLGQCSDHRPLPDDL